MSFLYLIIFNLKNKNSIPCKWLIIYPNRSLNFVDGY